MPKLISGCLKCSLVNPATSRRLLEGSGIADMVPKAMLGEARQVMGRHFDRRPWYVVQGVAILGRYKIICVVPLPFCLVISNMEDNPATTPVNLAEP